MAFTNIKGTKIYYEVHGHGDPIVLLHHGFGCTRMWKDIYTSLVEKGYRVIMYDRRGYGQSERGANFEEFYVGNGFRAENVQVLVMLMDILEIDSFHIIGQCEGGVIGIDYAVKFPEKIRTILAASTMCYSKINLRELNKLKFPKVFQELESDLKKKLISWHGKDYAESSYNMFSRYGGAYGKGLFDLRGLLPSVKCPALVLYPDRSSIFDVEQALAFYRCLPKGELSIFPNCGHNTYEYELEEYIRVVLKFLKRHNF